MMNPSLLITILIITSATYVIGSEYPPGFKSVNDCLFFFGQNGTCEVITNDSEYNINEVLDINLAGTLGSTCFSPEKPSASLVLQFEPSNNNMMGKMNLTFNMRKTHDLWELYEVVWMLDPVGNHVPNNTITYATNYMWATNNQSYSCNNLELSKTIFTTETKQTTKYLVTIKRFQIQPFKFDKTVFAPSTDCSVWLTLPMIMGFLLILLTTFTVVIVINLMVELGAQTKDLKFSKQGGMLMNQSQLESTKN